MVTSFLVYFVTFDYKNNVPWNLICGNPLKIRLYLYLSRKDLYFFLPVIKGLFQPQTTCTSTCPVVYVVPRLRQAGFHTVPLCAAYLFLVHPYGIAASCAASY